MTKLRPLQLAALNRRCDPNQFAFRSTRQVEPANDFLGQERVREAVRLALSIDHDGYNLFAVGQMGLGKRTMIRRYLDAVARNKPAPSDWCYVNNFEEARSPIAIELPPGMGRDAKRDLEKGWRKLSGAVISSFDNEQYYERMETLKGELSRAQQNSLAKLAQEGEKKGVKLVLRTPGGYGFSPMSEGGDVMSVQAFNDLARKEQERLKRVMADMEMKLRKVAKHLNQAEQANRDKVRQFNEEVALGSIRPVMDDLRHRYRAIPRLCDYLTRMEEDLVNNLDLILNVGEAQQDAVASVTTDNGVPSRYQINVIVSNDPKRGAPIVQEDLPTHHNLLGHVEQVTYMGTVATDFTLIRGGALHRANGGFLMLEAEQVLEQAFAWQGLKRALRSKSLRLSSLEQMLTMTGTISLEPEPIPFNVKVVLLGDRETFYLLQQFDPELEEFFKVRADFESSMPRNHHTEMSYARFLADFVQKEGLLPLDKGAVMRMIEESAREADDQHRLSLHAARVGDLLREANFWAIDAKARQIGRDHVSAAVRSIERRHDRIREHFLQDIRNGTQLFTNTGHVVGQVNGLSVLNYAGFNFGQPSRISVTAHCGSGDVLDIERDVDLGGALHSKGVMILSSYLKWRFGAHRSLKFAASIAFEQSYGEVDGDSASLGELIGLVSAISGLPVKQSFAITGSVNQFGEVQPIGGVNEKIEGYFAACEIKGLSGEQAVIIPAQNMQHLMLRDDVLTAVRQGKFRIYAVHKVEDAVELLLGVPAGVAKADGSYPTGTAFAKVTERLQAWHDAEKEEHHEEEKEGGKPEKEHKGHKKPPHPSEQESDI